MSVSAHSVSVVCHVKLYLVYTNLKCMSTLSSSFSYTYFLDVTFSYSSFLVIV